MGTISRDIFVNGYCPVDRNEVAIPIGYFHSRGVGSNEELPQKSAFFKSKNNKCKYLREGKCDKGIECPIFKEAADIEYVNLSGVRY